MNSQTEAQSQIDLIFSTLQNTQQLVFPKLSLVTYAVLIFLVPCFEAFLDWLPGGTLPALHLVFYALLFGMTRFFLVKRVGTWNEIATHPVLTRMLVGQQKFAAISLGMSALALVYAGWVNLIFPVLTYHIASLFYAFGKFSSRKLKQMAYAQMGIATLALEVLAHEGNMNFFPLFTSLLALTFVGGAVLK